MTYGFRACNCDLRMKHCILSMQISPKFLHSPSLCIKKGLESRFKSQKSGAARVKKSTFLWSRIRLLTAYCLSPLFFHPHYANGEVCVGDLCRYIHTVLTTELPSSSSAKTAKPTTCAGAVQIHVLSKCNGSRRQSGRTCSTDLSFKIKMQWLR